MITSTCKTVDTGGLMWALIYKHIQVGVYLC